MAPCCFPHYAAICMFLGLHFWFRIYPRCSFHRMKLPIIVDFKCANPDVFHRCHIIPWALEKLYKSSDSKSIFFRYQLAGTFI